MYDTRAVRCGQGVRDLKGILQSVPERQSLPADEPGQGGSRNELEGYEVYSEVGTDLVNGDDVRVVQRRRGTCLAQETREPVRIAEVLRPEQFQRYLSVQPGVVGLVNGSHAAFADPRFHTV